MSHRVERKKEASENTQVLSESTAELLSTQFSFLDYFSLDMYLFLRLAFLVTLQSFGKESAYEPHAFKTLG